MRIKVAGKKIFFVAFLTIISVLGIIGILSRALFYAPSDEIALPMEVQHFSATETSSKIDSEVKEVILPEHPLRLRIPRIEIDAKVQNVGITKRGNMATPNNYRDVGWFKYGAVPGERGNAIVAGHVDNGLTLPGVFADLEDLKRGDLIYVDTVGGDTVRFRVTNMETYDYTAKVEEIWQGELDSKLILITCTGSWLKDAKTHAQRLVITAIRI